MPYVTRAPCLGLIGESPIVGAADGGQEGTSAGGNHCLPTDCRRGSYLPSTAIESIPKESAEAISRIPAATKSPLNSGKSAATPLSNPMTAAPVDARPMMVLERLLFGILSSTFRCSRGRRRKEILQLRLTEHLHRRQRPELDSHYLLPLDDHFHSQFAFGGREHHTVLARRPPGLFEAGLRDPVDGVDSFQWEL